MAGCPPGEDTDGLTYPIGSRQQVKVKTLTKKTEKTETDRLDNGGKNRTAHVKDDDGEWLAQSYSVKDFLGRVIAVTTSLGTSSNFYDTTTGRLTRVSRTGMADTLYIYNELGELEKTIVDVDGDGTVDYSGLDRITVSDSFYQEISNDWWRVSISAVYNETNSANVITTSISRVRMTGLGEDTFNGGILTAQSQSEDWLENVTRTSTYTDAGSATTWTITDTPDSVIDTVQKSVAGYPVQSISSTAITNTLTYDGFARQLSVTDGRSNTTVTAYNDLGQVSYTQSSTNKTHYFYDCLGRRAAVSNALGQVAYTAYDPLGHAIATWGTSYPVAYQFDTAGRMVAMATTRSNAYANVNLNTLVPSGETLSSLSTENSALDITRWCYDGTTGLLTGKLYADGNGTDYTYTDSGRLAARTWARGITTTYSYDLLGQLTGVDYSQWSTPDVTYTHDRLGRTLTAISTASTNIFEYTGLALTKEMQGNYVIERMYDALGRAIGYELYTPDDLVNPVQTIIYGYSDNGRFHSVSSVHSVVTNLYTYSYLPGTDLISGYSLSQGGAAASLTVSRSYESDRNLITATTNAWNSSVISSFDYTNDPLGRRTKRIDYFNSLLSTNVFDYNIFGEVIEANMDNGNNRYYSDYDPIGNREQCIIYNGQLAITNSYSANNLNQYTSVSSVPSMVYPIHDLDGNLTYDGSAWHHSWDGENRLVKSEPHSATNGSLMFEYRLDHRNRRVQLTTKQLSGRSPSYPFDPSGAGTWDTIETRRYIWDGWNIIAELVSTNNSEFITHHSSLYTWGLDLSGSLQGAGGVGGLLSDTKVSNTATNVYYSVGDANGNVTEYFDGNGTVSAHYEYNASGEITSLSGSMANDFTHRFSTKPYNPVTGLVHYEQRPYDPILAIFLSRDPIEESDAPGLYLFLENDPVNKFDYLGLWALSFKGEWVASERSMVQGAFNTLKSRMPTYMAGWKSWASAASDLPDECAYKKAVQQELTVIYQIFSMIQDGLNSSDTMNVHKKDYGDKANASVGQPWNCWPYYLGNTFNGNLYLNIGGSNPFGGWSSSDMNVTIFHELSHVANVLQESGSDGMWSDYAHNVESIAKYGSELVLSPMVNWNIAIHGNKCCPPTKEWMPVKR